MCVCVWSGCESVWHTDRWICCYKDSEEQRAISEPSQDRSEVIGADEQIRRWVQILHWSVDCCTLPVCLSLIYTLWVSKNCANLTMAITLSILNRFVNFFTATNSDKCPTKPILVGKVKKPFARTHSWRHYGHCNWPVEKASPGMCVRANGVSFVTDGSLSVSVYQCLLTVMLLLTWHELWLLLVLLRSSLPTLPPQWIASTASPRPPQWQLMFLTVGVQ